MSWYSKYLEVYEKSYDAVAYRNIVAQVRDNLSKLQSDNPLVTVSVIAYNEEKHLLACLWALSEMKICYPIEVIGVDNDSKDKTAEIFQAVGIPYYTEYQHSCGYARLCGLSYARGKYHVNIDSDTLYPPQYVENMINVMERSPQIMGVCATWGYIPDKNHSVFGLRMYEYFRDQYLRIQSWRRPELSVRGLVFVYRTEPARKIGIRVDIKRGEDGMLAFNLSKLGKIAFLRNRHVRAITGYGTVGSGPLLGSFWSRVKQAFRTCGRLFTSAKEYKDQDYNLVNKTPEKK